MKIAVYSTFCGTTKNLTFNGNKIDPAYPHYFISNNTDVLRYAETKDWNPIYLNKPVTDDPATSAMQAKIAKAMPHTFPELNDYQYTLYLDDKKCKYSPHIEKYINQMNDQNASILIRQHDFFER